MTDLAVQAVARNATSTDVPELADALAAAFFEDPVLTWCFPNADRRREINPEIFRVIVQAALPGGEVYTTPDVVAGAVWVPPTLELDDETTAAQFGAASAEYADRAFTLLELMDDKHPKDREHEYLFILGTRPDWQSRGIGSALMRPVLERCDREGMPAYLEATSEQNVRLYLRHGFEVTEQVRLPDGPPLTLMWREPQG
jgi:GNAT superfamily N-acetyltransferase